MQPVDMARDLERAYHVGDWSTAAGLLTDDFTYVLGPAESPTVLSSTEVIGFGALMLAAFPDRTYQNAHFRADGDVVRAQQQFTGTHTAPLDLSRMQMGTIPATGRTVTLPLERVRYTFRDGRIARIDSEPEGATGLPELLRQLGAAVEPPS